MTNIGETIKRLRKEKHITQTQLANCIGVQASAISKYEKNIVVPSLEQIHKIADTLGVHILDIMYDDSTPNVDIVEEMAKDVAIAEEYYNIELRQDTIAKYDSLNALGQKKANEYITDLSEQEKYTTPDEEENPR